MIDRRVFLQLMAAVVPVVSLAACGGSPEENAGDEPQAEPQANMINPFVDCESAYDAAQLAGFDVTFPESVPGYPNRLYQAIEGEMAQCFYYRDDEVRVLVRKGLDDGSGDISGDYGEDDQVKTVTVGDLKVTEKGTNDLVYATIWTVDEYAFAIDADEGLAADVVEELVAATL